MKTFDESVLCFPVSLLESLPDFDKITKNTYSQIYWEDNIKEEDSNSFNACNWSIDFHKEILESNKCVFIDRNIAEKYETLVTQAEDGTFSFEYYKQIIPYVVIRSAFADEGEKGIMYKYLVFRRGKSGGESRLHDKISCGWGGHINTLDHSTNPKDAYYRCIMREIEEELGLFINPERVREVAVINDDSNDVGKVHFGIVSILDITPEEVANLKPEKQAEDLMWVTKEELASLPLESWSELVRDNFL
jgi:predicted NUDIX family phosphoesterase